ncbi:hypothetical protein RFI_17618 [Reticulomyxa filosa]|uniref:Uncharacterized protein n=1 Tax=Reticulomyxa filosa TaxID=46433 RepID=X6N0K9_RETFI|nr:hypothetical protein RFI_17618 [Reticulomyxa filosa]|eukprot:ETO19611.1 hypothetical protein RFI_17618 [Reticulomyxa filosa]
MGLQTYNEFVQWNLPLESMKPKKKDDRNCLLKAKEMKNERSEIVCVQIKDKDIMKSFLNLLTSLIIFHNVTFFIAEEDNKSENNEKQPEDVKLNDDPEARANSKIRHVSHFLKRLGSDPNINEFHLLTLLRNKGLTNEELMTAYIQSGTLSNRKVTGNLLKTSSTSDAESEDLWVRILSIKKDIFICFVLFFNFKVCLVFDDHKLPLRAGTDAYKEIPEQKSEAINSEVDKESSNAQNASTNNDSKQKSPVAERRTKSQMPPVLALNALNESLKDDEKSKSHERSASQNNANSAKTLTRFKKSLGFKQDKS